MKNQKGNAGIIGLVVILGLAFMVIMSIVSAGNKANEKEQGINASYKGNQAVLSGYEQKIKEAAQITTMQADDFSRVFKDTLQGRYGADGSKAMFQMIKEQNPNLDTKVYTKLQQIIEAGRDEFKTGQITLLDRCRVYDTDRGYMVTGFLIRLAGYPKLDVAKMCKPITTDRTDKAFEDGKESGPIKLR